MYRSPRDREVIVDEVQVRDEVVFGSGGGRELRCDIYTPPGRPANAAAVLMLHGGGWRGGDRSMVRGYGERLAAEGFVCVGSEYRLIPEAPWPAQIEDVKTALRWLRARSTDLGVDPERIALLGRSAGAHLALLAAGTPGAQAFAGEGGNAGVSETVQAVAAIFPPVLFYNGENRVHGGTPAKALLGDAATGDLARAASPVAYVSSDYPPTFLLHGTADTVVPPSASMMMYEALVAAGVPAELHMYAEQPHGFAGQPAFIDLCAAEIAHFLHRYLTAERTAAVAQPAATR
jgi:acetyl esterase/lipase